VFAIAGDGAMQMGGMAELITIARYWKRWGDPRLVVLVLDNGDLNEVTWEQRVMLGEPPWNQSQEVPRVPYSEWARLLGLSSRRVDDPEEIGPAWDEALTSDRPFVLQVVTDPDVPPLPPHIETDQARGLVRSLLHGDPHAAGVIRQSFSTKLRDFTTR
jgi:pyruvate dehydrogenase (quinone)